MKISIVIPAYNAAGTIVQALDSCMQQSHRPYEVIVVDDCSTDDTAAVVKDYGASVTLVTLEENSGPSSARNKGMEIAGGEVIAFLDADDSFHPHKLRILSEVFEQDNTIQFLGHPYTLGAFEYLPQIPRLKKKSYVAILASNPYQSSCIAIRSSLPERFDESMRYCEDHEFALRVAYRYGCYMLPYPLTRLGRPQLTKGGASANIWKMRKGELRAYTSVVRHNAAFAIVVPVLWLYSLAKFGLKLLKG